MNASNNIAKTLFIIGIAEIILSFILGLVFGSQEVERGYILTRTETEINWSIVLMWWIGGFISGMFIIGFAEVVKLLDDIYNRLDRHLGIENPEDVNLIVSDQIAVTSTENKFIDEFIDTNFFASIILDNKKTTCFILVTNDSLQFYKYGVFSFKFKKKQKNIIFDLKYESITESSLNTKKNIIVKYKNNEQLDADFTIRLYENSEIEKLYNILNVMQNNN